VGTPQPKTGDPFHAYLDYLADSNKLVERVYQLDKDHALDGAGSPEEKRRRLQQIIDATVDVDEIARFCLGQFWRIATPDQQAQYLFAFHDLLVTEIAGHLGVERVTTQNLKVVATDVARGLLMIHGAVPGAEGGYVLISDAAKRARPKDVPYPAALKTAPEAAAPTSAGAE